MAKRSSFSPSTYQASASLLTALTYSFLRCRGWPGPIWVFKTSSISSTYSIQVMLQGHSMWSVGSAVALGLAGAFSGCVVGRFIVSSRIMQEASVRSLNPPVMPFHMHIVLCGNAAHADDSVVCGVAC